MPEKAEFSEYSDNYPLKTGPETIDFTGFLRGYRRNGVSPMQGIDTCGEINSSLFKIKCRNGVSPMQGIDTNTLKTCFLHIIFVEME